MLVMFRVKNFMSFKDEVIVDMRATNIDLHPDHIIKTDKSSILKTLAIYGANGSGKSNLLYAMKCIKDIILTGKLNYESFALTKEVETTELEIIIYHHKMYQYGIEFSKEKVHNEWFLIDNEVEFELTNCELNIVNYNLDFTNYFNTHFNVIAEINAQNFVNITEVEKTLLANSEICEKISRIISKMKIGINKLSIIDDQVKTIHQSYDSDEEIAFDLAKESQGTIRFIACLSKVLLIIKTKSILITDELTTLLHPLVTKLIIDLFQASESQLVFTTHDTALLNNSQFRRDEVMFVDKSTKGASTIYSLADIDITENEAYNDNYIKGKYGAIPFFKYYKIIEDE